MLEHLPVILKRYQDFVFEVRCARDDRLPEHARAVGAERGKWYLRLRQTDSDDRVPCSTLREAAQLPEAEPDEGGREYDREQEKEDQAARHVPKATRSPSRHPERSEG